MQSSLWILIVSTFSIAFFHALAGLVIALTGIFVMVLGI